MIGISQYGQKFCFRSSLQAMPVLFLFADGMSVSARCALIEKTADLLEYSPVRKQYPVDI